MSNSTYSIPYVNGKNPVVSDLGFYADILFDADDSAPIYIGLHLTDGASQSDPSWKLYKFTYSGSNVTRIQLAYGAWSNRASLFP